MKSKILYIAFLIVLFFHTACTEPYEIEVVGYENVLVVESTITNEMRPQIVKLSRTSSLENTDVLTENNATVTVLRVMETVLVFHKIMKQVSTFPTNHSMHSQMFPIL